MSNERTTEEIVRRHLFENVVPGQVIEEQTSTNSRIRAALSQASKSGTGVGKPEFIITFPEQEPDLVIVIECKASTNQHISRDLDRPATHAVDGAFLYASHLSRTFDVISIAVSGTGVKDLRVSCFRQLKGTAEPAELVGPHGATKSLVPIVQLKRWLKYDPAVKMRTHAELLSYSRELHDYMRDYAKLSEPQKPLVVSAILLALQDRAFQLNWPKFGPRNLARELHSAIDRTTEEAGLSVSQREIVLAAYSFIKSHPELSKRPTGVGEAGDTPLYTLVEGLDKYARRLSTLTGKSMLLAISTVNSCATLAAMLEV